MIRGVREPRFDCKRRRNPEDHNLNCYGQQRLRSSVKIFSIARHLQITELGDPHWYPHASPFLFFNMEALFGIDNFSSNISST